MCIRKAMKFLSVMLLLLLFLSSCTSGETDVNNEHDKMNFNGTWSFTLPGYGQFPDATDTVVISNFSWKSFDANVRYESVDYETKSVDVVSYSGHFTRIEDTKDIPWFITETTLASDRVFESDGRYLWFEIDEDRTQICYCTGPMGDADWEWLGVLNNKVPTTLD